MSRYTGDRLADGTPLNLAIYRSFRNGGLSHNQSLAMTSEVGRENGFNAKYIFGGHIDPAGARGGGTIQNTGFLSWNGSRGANLQRQLQQAGLMKNGVMVRTQQALDAQARFAIQEMKSNAYRGGLKHFWANPNADPDSFARELGKSYIVWAYGQNSIRDKNGGRVAFDWKAHDNRRRGYLNALASMVGGGQQVPPSLARNAQQQRNAMLLVAQMGDYRLKDTGIGSDDHYDLRLARNANGSRDDINPYLNRFVVNGRGLHTYKQTGRFNEQRNGYRHGGVDFGINGSFGGDKNARNLYIAPEWQHRVKNLTSFNDKKGGGWVTQVEFDDGRKVNILHQNQQGVKSVMNAYRQGRQQYQAQPQARQQPQQNQRFLSQSQIAKLFPDLAQSKPQPQKAQSNRFLSQEQVNQLFPDLAKK